MPIASASARRRGRSPNRAIAYEVVELTSRQATNKVSEAKRRLAVPFPDKDRVDVAIATNMISVGLDITRLGLMVVLGQPKTCAEYIQATSRVGRDSRQPGLVVTLLNIHQPRDRSHYERFEVFHQSFYRTVEATSVTPFSPRAMDRGLAGTLVAPRAARPFADDRTEGGSRNPPRARVLEFVVQVLSDRAGGHAPLEPAEAEALRQTVRNRIDNVAHSGPTQCRRPLWLDERGTSGDLSEVWVRCECGDERPIVDATRPDMRALGPCDGWQPWLGPQVRERCDEQNRMLVRTASNAYFPQTMNVIALPGHNEEIAKAVDQVWEHHLQYVEDVAEVKKERKRKPPVAAALEGLSDEDVFAEIEARKQGESAADTRSVKEAEFETLVSSKDEIGSDRPDGDFFARNLAKPHWDRLWMAAIERVILVHRLREVNALVGFTRFESSSPDVQGELEIGVTRARLARDLTWLPAVENRGEGVFIQFRTQAIEAWLQKPAVEQRGLRLDAGFECWKSDHERSGRQFPGLPYILLHSLSHLLITAVSLECGYPASSVRERIYAGEYGYGILLCTGSPDAEGTMGGLVETGRQIARHLKNAIDLGRLCSYDPVCAQHPPEDEHECRFLHGAACHGCLLIAETSCEQHNDFLDRALVISTVDSNGAEFFGSDGA